MDNIVIRDLTQDEMPECNGGIALAAVALGFTIICTCVSAGYIFGKDCAERDRRNKNSNECFF